MENFLQVSREKDLRQKPEITLNASIIDDLGIDSLELMELAGAIEKELETTLTLEEMATAKTIGDVVDLIYNLTVSKS
ncbi:MAG: hypothetical protein A3C35_02830 [Omnitrophica bacterium RIFCSPHIGHO2_02_FULL_46_11]|nr:MAG: hypothetical protein A3C35_02830 [Omnitrophica bacterium RIFCSPHIGHO2_02_FULL_46_11]